MPSPFETHPSGAPQGEGIVVEGQCFQPVTRGAPHTNALMVRKRRRRCLEPWAAAAIFIVAVERSVLTTPSPFETHPSGAHQGEGMGAASQRLGALFVSCPRSSGQERAVLFHWKGAVRSIFRTTIGDLIKCRRNLQQSVTVT